MNQIGKNHWNSVNNQLKFFNELGKSLGFKDWEDWYQLKRSDVIKHGGSGLLAHFDGSTQKAITSVFPQREWNPNLFQCNKKRNWSDKSTQKQFLLDIFKQLKFNETEDWYKLTHSDVIKYGGTGISRIYNGSIFEMISKNFPEIKWKVWRFGDVPTGFWIDKKNHRPFLEDLGSRCLNIKTHEDWYKVSLKDAVKAGAGGFLTGHYANSLATAILTNLPEHPWKIWKFERVTVGFWNDRLNQRAFMEDLATALELQSREDWYKVTIKQLQEHGGGGFLQLFYQNSLSRALPEIYPEHNWTFLRSRLPKGYWEDFANHKNFFDNLYKDLNFRSFEDWYQITRNKIIEHGGASLFAEAGYSHVKALMNVYPEYDWKIWKFVSVPKGYWGEIKNLRMALLELYQAKKFEDWEDWYHIKSSDFTDMFGAKLFDSFEGSPMKMLMTAFPENRWNPWKFIHLLTPKNYWEKDSSSLHFLQWASEQLQIESLDNWKEVSALELRWLGGGPFLNLYGGMQQFLMRYYPNHDWEKTKNSFHNNPSKLHRVLHRKISDLLPELQDILINYSHPEIHNSKNRNVELDIYLPEIELAFEFQGEQHYNINHPLGDSATQQRRDEEKRNLLKSHGITLVEVPYWFFTRQYKVEKLLDIIRQQHPSFSFSKKST